jgi:hypothetical protein
MKKIMLAGLLLGFLLTGATAGAAQLEKEGPQAREIKIHKKQMLSEDERKMIDVVKGKPTVGDEKVTAPTSWATGIGVPLPEGGKRFAIVVGLANYVGTINDLCALSAQTSATHPEEYLLDNPKYYCQDHDSLNMQTALLGYGFDEIILLRDYQATRVGIINAMNSLSAAGKVTDSDEVVFFFSGHGVSGKIAGDKEVVDEAVFTYDGNYVWDNELKAWADGLSSYRTVFAFDICLAGGMNDLAGTNRVVVMSSGETQSSYTFSLGGATLLDGTYLFSEGLFSHSFVVNGMNNTLADGVNYNKFPDGFVAVEEAFSYAYPIVKIKQTPVLNDRVLNDLIP